MNKEAGRRMKRRRRRRRRESMMIMRRNMSARWRKTKKEGIMDEEGNITAPPPHRGHQSSLGSGGVHGDGEFCGVHGDGDLGSSGVPAVGP